MAEIETWFDDPETQRWLGGRSWPRRLVALAELPGRVAVVWLQRGEIVALLDIERYGDGPAAIALVVSPAHRGEGIGTAILRSIFDLAESRASIRSTEKSSKGTPAPNA